LRVGYGNKGKYYFGNTLLEVMILPLQMRQESFQTFAIEYRKH